MSSTNRCRIDFRVGARNSAHKAALLGLCLKCRTLKPLAQFGLRKMADGAFLNQPWCRTCRSGAGTRKPKAEKTNAVLEAVAPAAVTPLQGVPVPAIASEEEEPMTAASQG